MTETSVLEEISRHFVDCVQHWKIKKHKLLLILIRIFDKVAGPKKKKCFPHSCNKDLEMETGGSISLAIVIQMNMKDTYTWRTLKIWQKLDKETPWYTEKTMYTL